MVIDMKLTENYFYLLSAVVLMMLALVTCYIKTEAVITCFALLVAGIVLTWWQIDRMKEMLENIEKQIGELKHD